MVINFIRKIWAGEIDERVHQQFVRFSRGKFENRAVINVKNGEKIRLSSTFELTTELASFLAQLEKTFAVSGILLSRENPENLFKELGIQADVKKKNKVFQAEMNTGLTSEQLKKIIDIAYCVLFNMHSENTELKVKKKLPKPGKGNEKIDDKFCVLDLESKFFPQLHEEFLFDLPQDFKKARVSHTFDISNIILPKGEEDYEQIRLNAIRQGRIVRKTEADGKEKISGKDFKA